MVNTGMDDSPFGKENQRAQSVLVNTNREKRMCSAIPLSRTRAIRST